MSSTPRKSNQKGSLGKVFREFQPCEICGISNELTSHCVDCGKIVCGKDRQVHVKNCVDKLQKAKQSSVKVINLAQQKRNRISDQNKKVNKGREKVYDEVENDFRELQNMLSSRHKELTKMLKEFAAEDVKNLENQKSALEEALSELRKAEMEFNSRLANYTMMTNDDLNYLCQTKVRYLNCLRWIEELSGNEEKIPPIEFVSDSRALKDEISNYGEISFDQK